MYLLLSAFRPLLTHAGYVHATTISVIPHVHQSCSVLKALFPRSVLFMFSPLQQHSLTCDGRSSMETFHLGLSVLQSHSLHVVQVWISVFIPSIAGESFSDDGWAKHWSMGIAECQNTDVWVQQNASYSLDFCVFWMNCSFLFNCYLANHQNIQWHQITCLFVFYISYGESMIM